MDNNVRIRRYGFPIVPPDFGGTAHAYCGTTMAAGIGDLLPWFQRPRLDDMLKGYFIKSRGTLPGPQLLQDVLLNKITVQQAKKNSKKMSSRKKRKQT
eukprot:12416270-Karenia_brevis.AAC.1